MKQLCKQLLAFIGFFISISAYAQENEGSVIDFLTKKIYRYESVASNIDENDCVNYKYGSIYVPRFTTLADTNIQKNINNRIKNILVKNIESSIFIAKLSTQAMEAEKTYLRDEKSTSGLPKCELNRILYYPEITKVRYSFTSCYNNVVTMAASYTYHARVKNNKRLKGLVYTELYYFDLKTGKEYSQADIFKPNATAAIDALITQKYNRNEIFTGNKTLGGSYREYEEDYEENEERVEEVEEVDVESGDIGYAEEAPPPAERSYDAPVMEEKVMAVEDRDYGNAIGNGNGRNYDEATPNRQYEETLPIYKDNGYKPKYYYRPEEFLPVERKLSNFTYLKNGFLQLKAASISYTLAAYQTCSNLPYNTAAEIRLGLGEIAQYINPNGPYANLINLSKTIANGAKNVNTSNKNAIYLYSKPQIDLIENNPLEIADKKVKTITFYTKDKQRIKLYNKNQTVYQDTLVEIISKELNYANGRLTTISTNQNYYSSYENYIYDSLNRLKKIIYRNADSNYMGSKEYSYNAEGNILTEKRITENGEIEYCLYYTYFQNNYITETYQNNEYANHFDFNEFYFSQNGNIDSSFDISESYISNTDYYSYTNNGKISYNYNNRNATENGDYYIYNSNGMLLNYGSNNYHTILVYNNNNLLSSYSQKQEEGRTTKQINLMYNSNNQIESYTLTYSDYSTTPKLYFIKYKYE